MSSSPSSQEVELDDEVPQFDIEEEDTQDIDEELDDEVARFGVEEEDIQDIDEDLTPDIDEDLKGEVDDNNTENRQPEGHKEVAHGEVSPVKTSKKRATREDGSREAGKSLLPFSRVQKIIRADKDIPIMAKDATFLISLATEEFIKRICEASRTLSERENRSTVQYKDLAAVVSRADEFMFLEDIIPITAELPKQPRQFKSFSTSKPTRLAGGSKEDDSDIVMNEDGTMYAAGAEVPNQEWSE